MPKALSHFADPKFMKMLLTVAFEKWCSFWVECNLDGKGWTDAEKGQVIDTLIASVTKLYGNCGKGATVADAIKMRRQAFTDLGPDFDRALEMFESFLQCEGCWLKGEFGNRDFGRLFHSWDRMKHRTGSSFRAASRASSGVPFLLHKKLGHRPSVEEASKITLVEFTAIHGVGSKAVEALDAFRADCGYPPLK